MTVETKDILLKAAEDVQSGMWCKGDWFVDTEAGESWVDRDLFEGWVRAGDAQSMLRCAEGSVALAASLLGGDRNDYYDAVNTVSDRLPFCGKECAYGNGLAHFNDSHLPDDPFEAGQQLAELFRTTAEAL